MIDLSRDREAMLAEIGASADAVENRAPAPSDPAFLAGEQASVVVRGTWTEIVPPLRAALAHRFAELSPEQFIRDIQRPLKMGVGNAHKRGNRHSLEKNVTVEVVVTRAGAVLEVADEGDGFDVESTLRRFRCDEHYFTNRGGGFRAFERAASVVSYADGGRRLLIRFLGESRQSPLSLALDAEYMRTILRKLPLVAKRDARLVSLRARALAVAPPLPPELRYVLELRDASGEHRETVLTARLLPGDAARREHAAAKVLYKGEVKAARDLRVPKPMEVFKRHPRLVLYRFDPGPDLTASRTDPGTMHTVGRGLRLLHGSDLPLPITEDARGEGERRARTARRLVEALRRRRPDSVARALACLDALEAGAAALGDLPDVVPVHGSLGVGSVRRARDRHGAEHFYAYRLDASRRSHPGLDVGGLLADLDPFGAARDAFLSGYRHGSAPAWLEILPFFEAAAHLSRLERSLRGGGIRDRTIDARLVRCEAALQALAEGPLRRRIG